MTAFPSSIQAGAPVCPLCNRAFQWWRGALTPLSALLVILLLVAGVGRSTAFATETVGATAAPAGPAPNRVDDDADEFAVPHVSDPFEPVNRVFFRFNDGLYAWVLRPFAHGYEKTVPAPARRGLANFFSNLKFPARFVSSVLQGKPGRAAKETGKFLLNSTVGLAGFVRVSDSVPALTNLPPEDLGQTFGVWGIGNGPYLVLPLIGPSTLRDTVGLVGDTELNPLNWQPIEEIPGYDWTWRGGAETLNIVNGMPDLVRTYDSLHQAAVDPYVAMRTGYIQFRDAAIKR